LNWHRRRSYKQDDLTIDQQAGTGDLFSNTASGTNSLMTGGANNALNSAGNSASDLSSSSGDLVSRSPEPAVGVSQLDLPYTILITSSKHQ